MPPASQPQPLRVGILGAARGVPVAVLEPLRKNADLAARIEAVALAARDASEADASAKEWGIPRAYGSYEELLADPTIDAVYNVLPNHMRCQWTVSALLSGKHVLCETPVCSNAREAVVLQRAAEDAGKVMLEGSHPTCHPMAKRLREMVVEGKVGALERIDMSLPVAVSTQGSAVCAKVGALMGLGPYCVGLVRALSNDEPRVVSAAAKRSREEPAVDVAMSCELVLPSGAAAHFDCSVAPAGAHPQPGEVTVSGSNGVIRAKEWFSGTGRSANTISLEQFDGCGERWVESLDNPQPDTRDTYYYQLMSFADEVQAQAQRQGSGGLPWDYEHSKATPADAVRNMAIIDAISRAAGMPNKQTTFPPPAPYDHIGASKL